VAAVESAPGAYGAGRFVDWEKGKELLNLPNSDLLLSEWDMGQQRNVLNPFPTPKSLEDAIEAAVSVGWPIRGAA
jgi:hypothetical protein